MTFKELRNILSQIDRISVCDRDTLKYRNFLRIEDVPKRYDSLYVCGIGMSQSEFYRVDQFRYSVTKGDGPLVLASCIEVVTTKKKPEQPSDYGMPSRRECTAPSRNNLTYYRVCRVRCRGCGDILEYRNKTKADNGPARALMCRCGTTGLDPSASLYRIMGNDFEDLSEEWED